MNLKLKSSLRDALDQWVEDNVDSDEWEDSNVYSGEQTIDRMADAAATVFEL